MKKALEYYVSNKLLMWMSIGILSIGSLISLFSMRRENFPQIDFHEAQITTVFPGASPADVEQHVTIPLEEEIREVEGLKRVRSISRDSVSEINVQVDLAEDDPDGVLDDVRRAIDKVTDLPAEVTDRPVFAERKSGSFPILELSVYGPGEEHELRDQAKLIEEQLEKIPGVAHVDIFGERDREWRVLVDPEKLRDLRGDLLSVAAAIAGTNVNLPGGSFETENARNIRTDGEFQKLADLASVPLRSNEIGNMVLLRQVARFKDTYERPKFLARTNGAHALNLQVFKKERSDILTLVERVKNRIKELEEHELKEGASGKVKIAIVNDESRQTSRQLSVVYTNAAIGLVLVVLILMVFLNVRMALITATSLPLVLLGCMIMFPVGDITLNMVSMMGIIIALGMLVDNSIVIAENVYRYKEQGYSPVDAAVKGATELFLPILGSFLTTIAAFLPLMFMSGLMGEFIWQIPFMVISALTASMIESFFLLPARIAHYGGTLKEAHEHEGSLRKSINEFFEGLYAVFNRFIKVVIDAPFASLGVVGLALLMSLVGMGFMRFVLFPKEEVEQFIIKLEFDPSVRVTRTMERSAIVEDLVRKLPPEELVSYTMKGGIQQRDAADPLQRVGEHLSMVHVFLTPEVERERKAEDIIADLLPKIQELPGIKDVQAEELVPSPPIGAAVTIAVEGPEYEVLRKIAGEMKDYLGQVEGVINISDDYKFGREEVRVRLDLAKAAQVGVDTGVAARIVRAAFEGEEASTIRRGKEEIKIRVMYDDEFRARLEFLDTIRIPNRNGLFTPLGAISSTDSKVVPESLSHYDFERAVVVTADVREEQITSSQANDLVFKKFSDIPRRYPGYQLRFRGEQEDTQESMMSLLKAGIVALFAIFAILTVLFNDLRYPVLVLASIPLGLIGIVVGFLLSGKALSFLAMIGIIGLAGVQVNAAILLVTFVRQLRSEGLTPREALVEAAQTRFRPILLTTLTTMAGLFPTAYSLGGSDPVLIPMTLALAWGLAFGTFGSLVFIPAAMSASYKLLGRDGTNARGRGGATAAGTPGEQTAQGQTASDHAMALPGRLFGFVRSRLNFRAK